jgi:hypothetical protein
MYLNLLKPMISNQKKRKAKNNMKIIKVKREYFSQLMRKMKKMRLLSRNSCLFLQLEDSKDFQKSSEGELIKLFIEVSIMILAEKLHGVL